VFGIYIVVLCDAVILCEEFVEVFDISDVLLVVWYFKGIVLVEDFIVVECVGGVDVLLRSE